MPLERIYAVRISVVKPDHIGDLILSIPAIRVLERFYEVTLFVNPNNRFLAEYLFPQISICSLSLQHLSREFSPRPTDQDDLASTPCDIALFLRRDPSLERLANLLFSGKHLMVRPNSDKHETEIQKDVVKLLTGDYSRHRYFGGPQKPPNLRSPRAVGLCVSAGFSGNAWPVGYWLTLARSLIDRDIKVKFIGGPNEAENIDIISRQFSHRCQISTLVGDDKIDRFLSEVESLDYVIATDSGTAHICSLKTPIVSIFGPSPAKRYAPFGKYNRVLSADFYCSPCLQFDPERINHCVSRECLTGFRPTSVLGELLEPTSPQRVCFSHKVESSTL